MNKFILSVTLLSTCLVSNQAWANPSLGNSAIEQHNQNVQPNSSSQSNNNANRREPIKNDASLGRSAIEKSNANVPTTNSETSPQSNSREPIKNDASLGRSAIEKNNETLDSNMPEQ